MFAAYMHTLSVTPFGYGECTSYTHSASFITNTSLSTGKASLTVKVGGAAKTGAGPMSYRKNSSGQGIISSSSSTSGVCNVTGWLTQYTPFQGLSTNATCAQVASYTSSVSKSAISAGSPISAPSRATRSRRH